MFTLLTGTPAEELATEAAPTVAELLTTASAVVGAVLTLGGLAWWILKPRVVEWLAAVAADAGYARRQLDPTVKTSTAAAVEHAVELAREIPMLARRIGEVEAKVEPLEMTAELANANRSWLEHHERELLDHRRRLGNLEEYVITGRTPRHADSMDH